MEEALELQQARESNTNLRALAFAIDTVESKHNSLSQQQRKQQPQWGDGDDMSASEGIGHLEENNCGNGGKLNPVEAGDDQANSSSAPEQSAVDSLHTHRIDIEEGEVGNKAMKQPDPTEQSERTVKWLSVKKQASESQCRKLEAELLEARTTITQQATSLRVAEEKIRHLEAESKGLLDAAEFRENEASSFKEGASLAEERAHAHEKALASALEQLSDSGVSQSKKLVELASVNEELRRTRAALEQAERVVFEQRLEADERQYVEERRRAEMEALRAKLVQAERKNTELMTKDAAGRLAKKMRGNFGRSSTFCSLFCSCFRSRPAYLRVSSPATFASTSGAADSPWLS